MQGNLVTALKNGDWVLIDEINLASNDVLQKIVPLVEGKSLLLYEKGDLTHITRNPSFKIIACMNPATDSGKKPLPANLHEKFTAINLSQPLRNDIQMMVSTLCPQLNSTQIADIYFDIKKIKTVSLRNLSRALSYINKNKQIYGWQRAMYDGLILGFGQKQILAKYKTQIPPKQRQGFKIIHGFLVEQGPIKDQKVKIFHLTKTFSEHLKDFLRAIAGTDLPVLLQGPTSAGKTSIIKYVAQLTGYKCIRINNHQHTQIEQYLGNYFPDRQGKLVFRQGPLVTAVRQGHWLILDELNLAKTEILQCLNRLLDDNRELFIPEQQKHIKPHKDFRIFATQNPSSYSGRKKLSRAFRNRFISLLFGEITVVDTMAILQACKSLVADSKQLSNYIKKSYKVYQITDNVKKFSVKMV